MVTLLSFIFKAAETFGTWSSWKESKGKNQWNHLMYVIEITSFLVPWLQYMIYYTTSAFFIQSKASCHSTVTTTHSTVSVFEGVMVEPLQGLLLLLLLLLSLMGDLDSSMAAKKEQNRRITASEQSVKTDTQQEWHTIRTINTNKTSKWYLVKQIFNNCRSPI